MDRRGRTSEIIDLVHFDIEREGHIVTHQLEARIIQQMRDIGAPAGKEIIDAQDFVSGIDQTLAEMGSQKTGAAGYQDTLSHHDFVLL
jgi:hypothetical protein